MSKPPFEFAPLNTRSLEVQRNCRKVFTLDTAYPVPLLEFDDGLKPMVSAAKLQLNGSRCRATAE